MAQLFRFLFLFLLITLTANNCQAALSGSIDYKIPIEYSKINEKELSTQAEFYYNKALKTTDNKQNDDISEALILYTMLSNKNPKNIVYSLRAGALYDKIEKDRWAKGYFYRAMNIDPTRPEPYFYLGEFYFKRQNYRKALKMYKKAQTNGYSNHPQTVERLKRIYLMLGDYDALKTINK